MKNSMHSIRNSLPLVAQAIGRKLNTKVVLGGNQAHTDLKTVYLPDLPFEDPDVETLAFGYLEHECAHVRYTQDIAHLSQSALHHNITSLFEDIRIERELSREYPGYGSTLNKLTTKLVSDGKIYSPPHPDDSLVGKLQKYVTYRLRSEVLGQSALDLYAEVAENLFREEVSEGLAMRIGSVLGRVPTMESTYDAASLAAEVIQLINDEKDDNEPKEKPPETEDDQDQGETPDQDQAQDGQQPDDGSQQPDTDMAKALGELLKSSEEELGQDVGEQLGDLLSEEAENAIQAQGGAGAGMGLASEPNHGLGDPEAIIADIKGATIALRARLRGLLESSRRTQTKKTRNGHRISQKQLIPAMMGDPRLFEKKKRTNAINTVVQILLDRSSSMGTDQMDIAKKATLAAMTGLEQVHRIQLGAAAFPGHGFAVEPLTGFHEKVNQTAARYAAIRSSGGTPLLPALMWAADQVLQQSEERKIILIVTDGEPYQENICKDVIRRCWSSGIEVMGLGIDVESVADLFPVSGCIKHVDELATAMFNMLQNTLVQKRVA